LHDDDEVEGRRMTPPNTWRSAGADLVLLLGKAMTGRRL
jgi:hypothetical protein